MKEEDLKQKLIDLLNKYHLKTGGKCGISFTDISIELNKSSDVIKPLLNKLYKEKKIIIRKGINVKLIFIPV